MKYAPQHGLRRPKDSNGLDPRLFLICTSEPAARSALARAAPMLQGLAVSITLLAPQVVPYPLPLGRPPVAIRFLRARLRALVWNSGLVGDARIFLCRERAEALLDQLPKRCTVLFPAPRFWERGNRKLANALLKQGHKLLFL